MIAATAPSARRATPAGNITVDQCAQMQAEVRDLSKRDAVAVILGYLPHLSPSWINRNFAYVVELDADALAVVLTYADPTGESVAHNVDAGRTSLRGGGARARA